MIHICIGLLALGDRMVKQNQSRKRRIFWSVVMERVPGSNSPGSLSMEELGYSRHAVALFYEKVTYIYANTSESV